MTLQQVFHAEGYQMQIRQKLDLSCNLIISVNFKGEAIIKSQKQQQNPCRLPSEVVQEKQNPINQNSFKIPCPRLNPNRPALESLIKSCPPKSLDSLFLQQMLFTASSLNEPLRHSPIFNQCACAIYLQLMEVVHSGAPRKTFV